MCQEYVASENKDTKIVAETLMYILNLWKNWISTKENNDRFYLEKYLQYSSSAENRLIFFPFLH